MDVMKALEAEQIKENAEVFRIGDTVKVHFKIIEGKTERVQVFEGIVIAMKRDGLRKTFTVRKISYGVGVERIFPLHSPKIAKIVRVREGRIRRAKLYYLRGRAARRRRSRSSSTAGARRFPRPARAEQPDEAAAEAPGEHLRAHRARSPSGTHMNPGPVRGNIQIPLRAEHGTAARRDRHPARHQALAETKWAVAIRGKVYPASSELALQPGVRPAGARCAGRAGSCSSPSSDEVPDAVRAALAAQGLPTGAGSELIARALARSGLPLLADTIQKVKALLTRSGWARRRAPGPRRPSSTRGSTRRAPARGRSFRCSPSERRAARTRGATAASRFPETPARGQGLRRVPGRRRRRTARPCCRRTTTSAGRSQTWVVIPFVFGDGEQRVAGTFKILFDPFLGTRPGLDPCAGGHRLPSSRSRGSGSRLPSSATTSGPARAAARGLDSLRSKFHNMGLEVDDIVNEGNAFDGFSPVEEGVTLPSVDTVG